MADALIGRGFVGGNLHRQGSFQELYHSSNIETIQGRSLDLVVCAGAPGAKWLANKEPGKDLESLQALMSNLASVRARRFVLISTVDVYPRPDGVDEDATIDMEAATPYGRHRFMLEEFVRNRFESTVIRLPGLFGDGLKKNVIYDLLHDHQVDRICAESAFQFYDIANLWKDIRVAMEHRLGLVNFATEPTTVLEVARAGFGLELDALARKDAVRYDFRTKHAAVFGGSDGYICSKRQVLTSLKLFVERSRRGSG